MEYPEKIPKTSHKPFPLGDITDARSHQKAKDWIDVVGDYDRRQFLSYIRINGMMPLNFSEEARKSHHAAIDLCREWNTALHEDLRLASTGLLVAQTFIRDTDFLPAANVDFSGELFHMQLEKPTLAREFARHAWQGMAHSHPIVHGQFVKISEMTEKMLFVTSGDERDYLRAGMAIPYLLAAASKLAAYSSGENDFTSMAETDKKKVKKKAFARYFTKSVELAKDPTPKNNEN